MPEIYVDATNAIFGRLGSYVAKQALLGNTVRIFNTEQMIMSGSPSFVVEKYRYRIRETGTPFKGPFIPRYPDRFAKRIIRGMYPHQTARGMEAYKRTFFYLGVPQEFKDKPLIRLEKADMKKLSTLRYITLKDLCKALGGRA